MLYHKKALPNRQCTSFHATGCHFTGPVALRPRLSSGLSISLLFLNFCKKTGFIILWFSTVYKKNITALTPENQKNSQYIYSNCSSTFEVHEALTLLFPAHLYSDCSISLKLLSVCLSDSLDYLPEKAVIINIY